jgi:hypothetical protein
MASKVRKLLAKQLAGTNTYQGTTGKDPGILAYGHFTYPMNFHRALSDKHDCRIFIHTTDDYDIFDFFAYGKFKKGKEVNLHLRQRFPTET